jgi:hypothetical protein
MIAVTATSGSSPRDTPVWKLEASLKRISCRKRRYAPAVASYGVVLGRCRNSSLGGKLTSLSSTSTSTAMYSPVIETIIV